LTISPQAKAAAPKAMSGPAKAKYEISQMARLVKMLQQRKLFPVVVFTFSKRRCEVYRCEFIFMFLFISASLLIIPLCSNNFSQKKK
jgi:hypothetical protein